jgi:hypothetical protein
MSDIRPVEVKIVITSITAKSGGSIRGSFYTPELDTEERNSMMDLHDLECKTIFVPLNNKENIEVIKVDSDLHKKTQSERIRACLYRLWEKDKKPHDFPTYYQNKTEMIIEWIKQKLG